MCLCFCLFQVLCTWSDVVLNTEPCWEPSQQRGWWQHLCWGASARLSNTPSLEACFAWLNRGKDDCLVVGQALTRSFILILCSNPTTPYRVLNCSIGSSVCVQFPSPSLTLVRGISQFITYIHTGELWFCLCDSTFWVLHSLKACWGWTFLCSHKSSIKTSRPHRWTAGVHSTLVLYPVPDPHWWSPLPLVCEWVSELILLPLALLMPMLCCCSLMI